MIFYKLTDPIRSGDVIRAEGRKHYAYSFGPCVWVRTTVMMAYMNEDSPLYGRYEEVSEQEAQELVLKKSVLLARLLRRAGEIAEQTSGRRVDENGDFYADRLRDEAALHDDLEQKITALLQKSIEFGGATRESLLQEGFTLRIVRAVEKLTRAPGTDFYDYIRGLRGDVLARAVKMTDLDRDLDLNRITRVTPAVERRMEVRRLALRYLALEEDSLPEKAEEGDAFCPSMQAFQSAAKNALAGRKLPHGISNPVLRRVDDKVYLAYYVYTYTKAELDSGVLRRPSLWLLADVVTGEIVRRIDCAEQDFTTLPADARLSMAFPDKPEMTAEDFNVLYRRLDAVRRQYVDEGTLDEAAYEGYLTRMLANVPPAWRKCSQDLSAL